MLRRGKLPPRSGSCRVARSAAAASASFSRPQSAESSKRRKSSPPSTSQTPADQDDVGWDANDMAMDYETVIELDSEEEEEEDQVRSDINC